MVPPVRIELTASPLPRVRSTPELRRHPKGGGTMPLAGEMSTACVPDWGYNNHMEKDGKPAPAARKYAAPVRQKRCAPICNAASNRCVNGRRQQARRRSGRQRPRVS